MSKYQIASANINYTFLYEFNGKVNRIFLIFYDSVSGVRH